MQPLAAGIIGDIFTEDKRALAMGIYNFGFFIGYGSSFAVGTYVSDTRIFEQPWRLPFLLCGVPGIVIAIIFLLTTKEPRNSVKSTSTASFSIGQITKEFAGSKERSTEQEGFFRSLIKRPEIIIFALAACVRESGTFIWGYRHMRTQPKFILN